MIQNSQLPEYWFFYEYIFTSQVGVSYEYDHYHKTTLRQETFLPEDVIHDVAHWNVYRMSHYDTDGDACPVSCCAIRLIRKDDRIHYDYLYFNYDEGAAFLKRLQNFPAKKKSCV